VSAEVMAYPMSYAQLPQGEFQALQMRFMQVDKDRSGSISWLELQQALAERGEHFKEDTCKLMIRMFDRNRTGGIDFDEFIELNRYMLTMRRAFQALDGDRSGTLDQGEILRALQQGGYQLSPATFSQIWQAFDRTRNNVLRFDEYMELSLFLGIARNLFMWQDQDRDGWITIDYSTLVMLAAMMR